MEETRTTEIVRNPVTVSVCGHLEGTEGERFFVLLSGRPWVRIPPGVQKIHQVPIDLVDFFFSSAAHLIVLRAIR